MRVLIAGAGIGGLTTALCLAKAGHRVTVVEQAGSLSEIGAGLQCGANALRVMDYLGLLKELEVLAVDPQSVQFRDYKTGRSLHTLELGQAYANKYGAPYYHIHRADLVAVLAKAFNARVPNGLELNAKVVGFKETEDAVTLNLSDGRCLEGDCLIGADGVRSVIRDHLLGRTKPQFTGNVAWRAVVPVARLPDGWMDKITSNFVGPNKHVVLYYLHKQQLANMVGVVESAFAAVGGSTDLGDKPDRLNDSWVMNAPWAEMKADFDGWHSTVQCVIDAVDKDQCYRWALYNHEPFSNWSSKRVTLLGDAAHSTLPFMASGAAMAIEDARILERSLSQASSIADALQLYQHNRMPRTARIQKMSTQMGKLYHLNNKLLLKAAFGAINLLGSRGEAYLPEYDANTVELKSP